MPEKHKKCGPITLKKTQKVFLLVDSFIFLHKQLRLAGNLKNGEIRSLVIRKILGYN